MGIFAHDIGTGCRRVADDTLVERMIPDRGGRHVDAAGLERLRELCQVSLLAVQDFRAGFLERRRIEESVAAQVLVVVANKKFELRAGLLCQPGGLLQGRLILGGRIDDAHDLLDSLHCWSLSGRVLAVLADADDVILEPAKCQ